MNPEKCISNTMETKERDVKMNNKETEPYFDGNDGMDTATPPEREDDETLALYAKLYDDNTLTWCQKIDKIVKHKRKTIPTWSVSNPFIMPEEGKNPSAEDIAKAMFQMMYYCAKGKCEDITDKVTGGLGF